ncbi:MAG: hypothetical protein MO847_00075 [Candidatus Protistobacter heckmanni]|nr:hypothetical protein [Candidatus Protistobacter heckmanni]
MAIAPIGDHARQMVVSLSIAATELRGWAATHAMRGMARTIVTMESWTPGLVEGVAYRQRTISALPPLRIREEGATPPVAIGAKVGLPPLGVNFHGRLSRPGSRAATPVARKEGAPPPAGARPAAPPKTSIVITSENNETTIQDVNDRSGSDASPSADRRSQISSSSSTGPSLHSASPPTLRLDRFRLMPGLAAPAATLALPAPNARCAEPPTGPRALYGRPGGACGAPGSRSPSPELVRVQVQRL